MGEHISVEVERRMQELGARRLSATAAQAVYAYTPITEASSADGFAYMVTKKLRDLPVRAVDFRASYTMSGARRYTCVVVDEAPVTSA